MNLKECTEERKKFQRYTWLGLPLIVMVGWFFPLLGFLFIGWMAGAVGLAFYRGRTWCNWMCPRGSFYDLFLAKFSNNKKIPAVFRSTWLRITVMCIIFTVIGVQLYIAWPEPERIGQAFVIIVTIPTIIGVLLGLAIHPRTWCHICPLGTTAKYLSHGKYPLMINNKCDTCGFCEKNCPMQLAPYFDKGNTTFRDDDCIKCGTCVAGCPNKVLSFRKERTA